jgi:protein-disulfide isomerase
MNRLLGVAVTFWSVAGALLGCGASAPDPIAAEEAKTGPDRVTIVEFVDYRCTFCRQQADVITQLLSENAGAVRFVVKHVPLQKHPGARRAAKASVCAEAQGKLEPMHEGLMRAADTADRTILDLGQEVGLDMAAFQACLAASTTDDRIQDDMDAFEAAGGDGLPMTFIGRQKFVGLTDPEELEKAMRQAQKQLD